MYCVVWRPCPSHFLPSVSIRQRPPVTPTWPRPEIEQQQPHAVLFTQDKFNHMMFSVFRYKHSVLLWAERVKEMPDRLLFFPDYWFIWTQNNRRKSFLHMQFFRIEVVLYLSLVQLSSLTDQNFLELENKIMWTQENCKHFTIRIHLLTLVNNISYH